MKATGVFPIASLLLLQSVGADLLCEFDFNGSGSAEFTSAGSVRTTLHLRDPAGRRADRRSAGGTGVSGKPGDKALDNSDAITMGNGGGGGFAESDSVRFPAVDSYTVSAWYKAESGVPTEFARIVDTDIMSLYFFQEAPHIQNTGFYSHPFVEVGQWVFVAATYDGTKSADNVDLYKGSKTGAIAHLATLTSNRGTVESFYSAVLVGGNSHTYVNPQPFDGLIDNLRIHGGTGSSGALGLAELEALRKGDVTGSTLKNTLVIPALKLESIGDQLRLRWSSVAGQNYQLRTNPGMKNSAWRPQGAVVSGDGATKSVMWPKAGTTVFYDLLVTPSN